MNASLHVCEDTHFAYSQLFEEHLNYLDENMQQSHVLKAWSIACRNNGFSLNVLKFLPG